ncbi:hypothetical protein HOC13_02720 [Candidatus Woesearchaeota archaeon]|nr:hypothetical protein [Candidatus Woesearchaeota archaeon]
MMGLEKSVENSLRSYSRECNPRDNLYEWYAAGLDIASTGMLILAAAYEPSMLKVFPAGGAIFMGLNSLIGDVLSESDGAQAARKALPILGTIAGVLAIGYYLAGDPKATVMGGLAGSCYAYIFASKLRSKKEVDDPQKRGLIGLLSKNENN